MINFQYARANDVAEAVRLIGRNPNAKFIAGGTNLIDLMKIDVEQPTAIVDISRLPLKQVETTPGGGLRIGALVRNADLAYHPLVEQRYPVLASAIMAGASQQLRNMASTGGNLLQRTRCHYFYDTATACNKREPGSGCSAIDGHNRMHAIFGASDFCIAVHPSDMCVALAILEAKVHATSASGDRVIAFADLHRLPGDTPQRDTSLDAGEIITAVELPARGFAKNYTYLKIRDRLSYAFALVSVAVGLELDGDVIKEGRFALGGVAHKPWRDPQAEAELREKPAIAATFARAADVLLRDAKGYGGNTFKIDLARRGGARAHASGARHAAVAVVQEDHLRTAMAPYIGTATSRIDGVAKVTGAAKYAAEFNAPGLLHSSVVTSTIAKGRMTRIDTSAAKRIKGVLDVITHANRPQMADDDTAYKDDVAPSGSPFRPLYGDRIMFSGQPIALVVAETWEIARFAASLVQVEYEKETHVTDVYRQRDAAAPIKPPTNPFEELFAPPKTRGVPEPALAAAAVRHEAEYYTPMEHHNPMELYAATVIYEDGGKLTVYDKTQGVQNVQRYLCSVFGMKPEELRVISPYVGGGFGVGLRPQIEAVLAVLAARALRHSVRVVLTRPQMYALGYRPATIQRIALGANAGATLDAITHDAVTVTSQYEDYNRQETGWSGALYTCANAKYAHKLVKLDLPTSCDMRCPSAATGVYALECAMDELAVALKIDPLELRLRCYSERNQNIDQPFSSKALRECYRQGAEAFGWDKRNPEPRSMRDGDDLVGWGMATGIWDAFQAPITVRIILSANGHAEVACATSDIGTGTYTIMAQVAADQLGLPLENISVKLGDSSLPQSPVEGGSWIAASVSNGIATTAAAVRDELLRLAEENPDSPLANAASVEVELVGGRLVSKVDSSRSVSIADAMRHGAVDRVEREITTNPSEDARAHHTHSAVFAEVKVDGQLGVVRVTRVVSAVAAGRILNPKTAGSQILGSVVWGIGMALREETLIDHRDGRIVNANIAEYLVPVNADVQDIQVIFVDELEDSNPLGVKGVGEIGIVGVPAAIANAVYHATGKRVRDLPITLDKLLQ